MPKSGGACRFKSSCSERVRAAGDQQPPIASRRCTVCPFRPVLFARQPPLRCMSFSPEKEQLVSVHFLGEVELTPVSIAKKLNSSFYAQCMSCLPCRPLRPAGRLREPIPRRGASHRPGKKAIPGSTLRTPFAMVGPHEPQRGGRGGGSNRRLDPHCFGASRPGRPSRNKRTKKRRQGVTYSAIGISDDPLVISFGWWAMRPCRQSLNGRPAMTEPKDLLLVNEQLRRSNRLLRWLKRGWQTLVLALALVLVVSGVIWGIAQLIWWVKQRVLSNAGGF
jgi:hypothetical protein